MHRSGRSSHVANQYVYDGDGHVCAVKGYAVDGMAWMVGYVYDGEGRRVAKGTIASLSCDPSTNGFAPINDEVLGQQGEQVTELGLDVNGMMAWQHTSVYANGAQIAAYDADGLHFLLSQCSRSEALEARAAPRPNTRACCSRPARAWRWAS